MAHLFTNTQIAWIAAIGHLALGDLSGDLSGCFAVGGNQAVCQPVRYSRFETHGLTRLLDAVYAENAQFTR